MISYCACILSTTDVDVDQCAMLPAGQSGVMDQRFFQLRDGAEAGRKRAANVAWLWLNSPVVYPLPRGGVPVALEITRALHPPLDPAFVRKSGTPGHVKLLLSPSWRLHQWRVRICLRDALAEDEMYSFGL
jgi:hypothetical protein